MTAEVLDRPFWEALTGPQSSWARREGRAACYDPDAAPFAALADVSTEAWADLATLLGEDGAAALFFPSAPEVPPVLDVVNTFDVTQMVLRGLSPAPDVEAAALGPDDTADMLELVRLARPGPFRARTVELGGFLGVRGEDGRLLAMAGERARPRGFSEVSGVCVHPDARGRGLAAALVTGVARAVLARSETPFLHVNPDNHAARSLYRRLGFEDRATLRGVVVRRAQPV
ncbi:GNAT family N-acetyltransferase [Deinococcus pimensis]|uniref:GNAT family N-acetyltransferase n=1 Tax=Deinococcus pimensis TaxID=309888 RepID=UPI00047F5AD0|nr:GNAT family N-acetyltransferase [Deinococcus pimensis]